MTDFADKTRAERIEAYLDREIDSLRNLPDLTGPDRVRMATLLDVRRELRSYRGQIEGEVSRG